MADRIFMGKNNGRTLLRVSGPGYNATNLADPAVFSSEGDYLKMHHIIDEPLSRYSYEFFDYTVYEHYGTWSFPALPYIPMAFISIVHTSSSLNGRVFFPGDNYPATAEARDDIVGIINKNRVWVGSNAPDSNPARYRVRIIIFKNPADMVIE